MFGWVLQSYLGAGQYDFGYDGGDGQLAHAGAWTDYGSGFRHGDTVRLVLDLDRDTIEFIVNGSALEAHPLGGSLRGLTVFPAVSLGAVGDRAAISTATPPPVVVARAPSGSIGKGGNEKAVCRRC